MVLPIALSIFFWFFVAYRQRFKKLTVKQEEDTNE